MCKYSGWTHSLPPPPYNIFTSNKVNNVFISDQNHQSWWLLEQWKDCVLWFSGNLNEESCTISKFPFLQMGSVGLVSRSFSTYIHWRWWHWKTTFLWGLLLQLDSQLGLWTVNQTPPKGHRSWKQNYTSLCLLTNALKRNHILMSVKLSAGSPWKRVYPNVSPRKLL